MCWLLLLSYISSSQVWQQNQHVSEKDALKRTTCLGTTSEKRKFKQIWLLRRLRLCSSNLAGAIWPDRSLATRRIFYQRFGEESTNLKRELREESWRDFKLSGFPNFCVEAVKGENKKNYPLIIQIVILLCEVKSFMLFKNLIL